MSFGFKLSLEEMAIEIGPHSFSKIFETMAFDPGKLISPELSIIIKFLTITYKKKVGSRWIRTCYLFSFQYSFTYKTAYDRILALPVPDLGLWWRMDKNFEN